MAEQDDILVQVLRDPLRLKGLKLQEWNALLPQARACHLLARLADDAIQRPGAGIPPEVLWHLASAREKADNHAIGIRWEVRRLDRILAGLGTPVVLLKGPAYMMLGLPWGRGRICRDIDLLVPRSRLADVERCLLANGWATHEMSAFQEWFFRKWLHEIPAMVHRDRGTAVDVHHNILPHIDSIRLDSDRLIADSLPLEGCRCLRVLTPDDRLLHSAAHLFRRGFYAFGLRDLADMDGMMRGYTGDDEWARLLKRAAELRLGQPLYLAFRYAGMLLGTPVPAAVQAAVREWRPRWPPLWVLDRLVRVAVLPPRLDGRNRGRAVAQWILERYPLSLWKKTILPKLGVGPGRGGVRE